MTVCYDTVQMLGVLMSGMSIGISLTMLYVRNSP